MWITTKCSKPAALSFFLIIQDTNYSLILISSSSFIKLCVLLCVGPLVALSRASCNSQTTLWKQSNRWPWAVCLRGVLRVKRAPVCCKRSFVVIILWLNLLTEARSLLITSVRQTSFQIISSFISTSFMCIHFCSYYSRNIWMNCFNMWWLQFEGSRN